MYKTISVKIILILFLLFNSISISQSRKDSKIELSAGIEYKSNCFHNLLFGKHWRDVWTTPVQVEILNVNTFAGGLTPIKKGGGFQTKSLRFKGNDGNYWKFRSIEKDPSKTLPEELRGSIADEIIQDQISSANPYGALVVVPILDSLNILQAKPYLYYLPNTEELGKYQSEFGGMLGMIEIHPDVEKEENISFYNSDKIESTFDLFERLEKKEDEFVDSKEYLKARLVDIFLGDWDRHHDQWKWARYKVGGKQIWKPIPRDRDQAFAKFDGILPSIAEYLVMQFNSFEHSYNNIEKLTWNGRFVDRRFLAQITKSEWDSVAYFVKEKLTDNLLNEAMTKFPIEVYSIAKDEIFEKLKSRRDKLISVSDEYYNFINKVVDIYGGTNDDYVEINRIDDKTTSLKLFKEYKKNINNLPIKETKPYFHRNYFTNETDEIRLYLDDGDDIVKLRGSVSSGILIRIISGDGKDTIIDSSRVSGNLLSFLPIPDAENKTKVYDSGKKTEIVFGDGTVYDDGKVQKPETDEEKYRPLQRDRSNETFIFPLVSYSTDDGFIVGGQALFYNYGFRAIPYQDNYKISAKYASEPNSGAIDFSSNHYKFVDNSKINFNVSANQLKLTKYYGYGNETEFSEKLEAEDYYRLKQTYISLSSSFQYLINKNLSTEFNVNYLYSNIELVNQELLEIFPFENYGTGKHAMIKTEISFNFDSRDNEIFTENGFFINGRLLYSPKILDNSDDFSGSQFDFRSFHTSKTLGNSTFGLRLKGEKLWGKFPFFAASFLGGGENLLGFRRERFSGNASLLGSIQYRIPITKVKLIINGTLGIHGLAESGRVFTETENSKIWHSNYGGGIWISYLDRTLNVVSTVAKSNEALLFYLGFSSIF